MRTRAIALAVLCVCASARPRLLFGQCPDGTPPPCRGATARRPAPALDDKTWIIVPFENVARVPEIDWLKDASVNLLYLDMSKWRDIRVIDDERVADFIREVPEARTQMTLQWAIAVARRAGAGKLVMGDLLRVGSRTQLIAKVFDVRSGQRLRTVRQDAAGADSIMPAFGQLARGVLDVEPPTGTSLGAIGTASLSAYQEYLLGVRSLNAFNLPDAGQHFERALQLDSTFALAHYKLTLVIGWGNASDPAHLAHAQAAARLGSGLPPRERTLIAGQLSQAQGDYGHACELYRPLLAADSNDVEALYNFGECNYHDAAIVPLPADSTRLTFRGSWNASLRAFRRVLALDPSYHLAFQHIGDMLLAEQRSGCRLAEGRVQCSQAASIYAAVVRRDGDSLFLVPVNIQSGAAALVMQSEDARVHRVRGTNLEQARAVALEWLLAGPSESRPMIAYGHILLQMGMADSADAMFRRATGPDSRTLQSATFYIDRFEAAMKIDHFEEAWRLADSVRAITDTIRAARGNYALGAMLFGRVQPMTTFIDSNIPAPPAVKHYFSDCLRVMLGLPADSIYVSERALVGMAGPLGASRIAAAMLPSLALLSFRERGARWPLTLDSTVADPRAQLISVLQRGDTAAFRRALARFDSTSASLDDVPDDGSALLSANAHLLLNDSAGALQRLGRFRATTWRRTPMMAQITPGLAYAGWLWARSFLLLGDLAAAQGQRDVAADAYRRFIGMWQHADPEAQPVVERARAALARLGN